MSSIILEKHLKKPKPNRLWENLVRYRYLHLLALPGILYFLIFKYVPMYGIIIAFKQYYASGGFWGIIDSPWIGFAYFESFFSSIYFVRLMWNTLIISSYNLLFGFPAPIILALLLNEIKNTYFKRTVQTITYMPHFLSWIVIAGFMTVILSPSSGPVAELFRMVGWEPIYFLGDPKVFRGLLVVSNIWREVGYGTIIYLAAIASIDQELYEAATVDGAQKWHQIRYITWPSIKDIASMMLILQLGRIFDNNFDQILNLYNEQVWEVADVFQTFVYRQGVTKGYFAYSAAVGLFQSVVSLILILGVNKVVKKMGSSGLI